MFDQLSSALRYIVNQIYQAIFVEPTTFPQNGMAINETKEFAGTP
jgi:hypothetical protein